MTTQTQANIARKAAIVNPLNLLFAALADLQRTAPAFFMKFEDADLETGTRAELMALLASAPNDLVKGFILGKLTMRISIQTLAGREFA